MQRRFEGGTEPWEGGSETCGKWFKTLRGGFDAFEASEGVWDSAGGGARGLHNVIVTSWRPGGTQGLGGGGTQDRISKQ